MTKKSTKILILSIYKTQKDLNNIDKNVAIINKQMIELNYLNYLLINAFKNEMLFTELKVRNGRTFVLYHNTFNIPKIFPVGKLEDLKLLFHDDPPFSYADEKRKIHGVEGKFIDEFVKKYNLSYKIVNKDIEKYNLKTLDKFDLSLSRFYRIESKNVWMVFEKLWLNEKDGVCLLVPRNIPVSAIENFSSPFDSIFATFLVISLILITSLWMFFKKLQKENGVTFQEICFEIGKALIGNKNLNFNG